LPATAEPPGRKRGRPPADATGLDALGLAPGMAVRFRRRPGERWRPAVVERVERDGSLGLRDRRGAARAIPLEQVEVATSGPRGARTWEPALERAARTEQLRLL
jgi:hypothetical protein